MDNDEESNERVACPNDLCTGALDHEGRCGTCDMVFSQYARAEEESKREGAASEVSEATVESPREEAREEDGDDASSDASSASYRASGVEADRTSSDDERACCDDDLCTGALGPDGVCGTCGRSSIKLPENTA